MKLIPLSGNRGVGLFAKVDDDDYEWLSTFTFCNAHGYPQTVIPTTLTRKYMHQLLLASRKGLHVDHINRDKLDNRRANLRYVTHGENLRNTPARIKHGIKGVYLRSYPERHKRPWSARVTYNRKLYHLGCFATMKEAAAAIVNFWDAPDLCKAPKPQVRKRAKR